LRCGDRHGNSFTEEMMEAIIERCAGLDVHQATVVACVLIGEAGRKPHKEIRTFSTMTRDLEAMRDWLKGHGVTHVGMESTGIYWKPVHTILEGHFELIVANAHHIKTVPGPTSRMPSGPPSWCATAWSSRASCHHRPSATCVTWSGYGAPWPRRWPPSRTARSSCWNIKLASVVSQVFGVSGRAMLKALIENTATPQEMADLAKRSLRRKLEPWRWTAG
jgi:transposase